MTYKHQCIPDPVYNVINANYYIQWYTYKYVFYNFIGLIYIKGSLFMWIYTYIV